MSSQGPNIGINFKWTLGESGWNLQMDENLIAIDALLLLSVKSATTSAPPGSPVEGDRYLVPTGATGAWGTHDGKIARFHQAVWEFYIADEGWEVRAEDSLQRYYYDGSNWGLVGSNYAQHADDSAASAGNVPLGGMYVNTVTGALSVRLV